MTYPPPMTVLDFGPEPHSEVTQWVKRVFETLQERRPFRVFHRIRRRISRHGRRSR